MFDVPGPKAFKYKLMRTLRQYDRLHSPTVPLPVRPNKRHPDPLSVTSLEDGRKFKQLDLGQDSHDPVVKRPQTQDRLPRFYKVTRTSDVGLKKKSSDSKRYTTLKTEPNWSQAQVRRIKLQNEFTVAREQQRRLNEMLRLGKLMAAIRKQVLQGKADWFTHQQPV